MADLVEDLKQVGVGALMFTVDVARAYKNFRVDPLDWPLMCIKWNQEVFVEMAMLFGARSSYWNMQTVANMIVRILSQEGIQDVFRRPYSGGSLRNTGTGPVSQSQGIVQGIGAAGGCGQSTEPRYKC